MAFNPEPVKSRRPKNFRIDPEAAALIDQLAEHYGTTQGRAIEELVMTYAPKLLEKKPS